MISDKPTREEIEALIDRNEIMRAKWKGNPDYARTLAIEQYALRSLISGQPQPNLSKQAWPPVGKWLSAALDDPQVCKEMKDDIRAWFAAGQPVENMLAMVIDRAADIAKACDSKRGNEKLIAAAILDLKEEFKC